MRHGRGGYKYRRAASGQSTVTRVTRKVSHLQDMKHLLTALVVVLSAALPGEQILGSAAGAGCSRRYLRRINGKCYYFSVKKMNWHGALNNCLRKGLTLADLSNPRDFYGAIGFLSSKGNTEDFWFGGNDLQHEGRFQYISNGRLVRFFSNYSIVEPAEHSECDDCLEVRIRSNMTVVADDNCLERQYFICSERYCDDSGSGSAAKPKHHSHEHLHHFHHDIGDSDGDEEEEVNDAPPLTSGSVEHEGSESEGAVEFADLPDELNITTSTTPMMEQMERMLPTDMGPPPSDWPPTTVKDEDEEGTSDVDSSSMENIQRKLGSSDEEGEDEARPPGDGPGTPPPPPGGEGSTPGGAEGEATEAGESKATTEEGGGETKSAEGGVTTAGEGGRTAGGEGEEPTGGEGGAATAGEGGDTTAGEGGVTTAGEGGATTAGEEGGTTAGEGEGAAAGEGVAAGEGEKTAAGEGGATTAGEGAETAAGEGGATTAGEGGAPTAAEGEATTAGAGGGTPAAEGEAATAAEGGATAAAPEGEATTAAAEGETPAARAPRVPRSQRAARAPLAAMHHLI